MVLREDSKKLILSLPTSDPDQHIQDAFKRALVAVFENLTSESDFIQGLYVAGVLKRGLSYVVSNTNKMFENIY